MLRKKIFCYLTIFGLCGLIAIYWLAEKLVCAAGAALKKIHSQRRSRLV